MNRTEARERIMQLLYQMDIQGDYSRECRERYLEANFRKKQSGERIRGSAFRRGSGSISARSMKG